MSGQKGKKQMGINSCRYRTLELVVEKIRKKYSSEKLLNFLTSEAGVYRGNFFG